VALPAALRRLDRDDVGAKVSQRLYPHGPQQEMVEADDADAFQEVEHGAPLETATAALMLLDIA
jgi:hypothetical protein